MSTKHNGTSYSMSRNSQIRRRGVIERLTEQLASGKKNTMVEKEIVSIPLTPPDVTRIQRDIETLKKRS